MSEPIIVSTEGITAATGGLDDLSNRLTNISTNLRNRIGDLGGVWGEDKAGQQFRAQYEGPSVQLMTALPGLAEVLDSVAEGLRVMSRNYEAAEEQAGVLANNLTVDETTPTTLAPLQPATPTSAGQVVRAALSPSVPTQQKMVRAALVPADAATVGVEPAQGAVPGALAGVGPAHAAVPGVPGALAGVGPAHAAVPGVPGVLAGVGPAHAAVPGVDLANGAVPGVLAGVVSPGVESVQGAVPGVPAGVVSPDVDPAQGAVPGVPAGVISPGVELTRSAVLPAVPVEQGDGEVVTAETVEAQPRRVSTEQ